MFGGTTVIQAGAPVFRVSCCDVVCLLSPPTANRMPRSPMLRMMSCGIRCPRRDCRPSPPSPLFVKIKEKSTKRHKKKNLSLTQTHTFVSQKQLDNSLTGGDQAIGEEKMQKDMSANDIDQIREEYESKYGKTEYVFQWSRGEKS